MKNRKIDKKTTKQVVIDIGYHKLLKKAAVDSERTIKAVLEECLSEYLDVNLLFGGKEVKKNGRN